MHNQHRFNEQKPYEPHHMNDLYVNVSIKRTLWDSIFSAYLLCYLVVCGISPATKFCRGSWQMMTKVYQKVVIIKMISK